MEVNNCESDELMVRNVQPAVLEAPETAGDEKNTTSITVAGGNGDNDQLSSIQGTNGSTSLKRAAEEPADSNHLGGGVGEQPVEPAAKRARADEQLVGDSNAQAGDAANAAAGQEQMKPEASLQDSAAAVAVAESPSKARKSPTPGGSKSPATKRAGDVVLRLLVPDRSVATIIGKGGGTVKAIQSSSGARVQAMPPIPGAEERVIIISKPEDAQQAISGAERALHAIQNKLLVELEPTAAAILKQVQQELAPQPAASAVLEPAAEDSVLKPTSAAVTTGGAEDASEQQATPGDVSAPTAVNAEEPAAAPQQTSTIGGKSESTMDATTDAAAIDTSTDMTPAEGAPVLEQPTAAAGDGPAANIPSSAAADIELTAAVDASKVAVTDAEGVIVADSKQPATAATGLQQQPADVPAPPVSPGAASASIPALGGDSPAPARSRNVQHVARMLVSPSQASSLLTAGAAGLRAIKEQAGAYVKVLQADESPLCALDGDRVTQVVGSAEQVFRAVLLLGAHLRKHPAQERPGGMHPSLSARVGGGRRYGGRGSHRSPPPPPPPRPAYGGQYGAYPGYGPAQPGYGPPVHAYGAAAAYGAPPGPPGYRPPAPPGTYSAPPPGSYDQMYQGYGY